MILLFVLKHAVHTFSAINIVKQCYRHNSFMVLYKKKHTQNTLLFLRGQSEIETPLQGAPFES